jgi:hypothetical protein
MIDGGGGGDDLRGYDDDYVMRLIGVEDEVDMEEDDTEANVEADPSATTSSCYHTWRTIWRRDFLSAYR